MSACVLLLCLLVGVGHFRSVQVAMYKQSWSTSLSQPALARRSLSTEDKDLRFY